MSKDASAAIKSGDLSALNALIGKLRQ